MFKCNAIMFDALGELEEVGADPADRGYSVPGGASGSPAGAPTTTAGICSGESGAGSPEGAGAAGEGAAGEGAGP